MRRRPAFTLMETLLAIALMAGLMAAAVTVLFQVSSAWTAQADDPVLDRHAAGLDRFVRRLFAESGAGGLAPPTPAQVTDEQAILALRVPADLPWVEALATAGGLVEGRLAFSDAGEGAGKLWLHWGTRDERRAGRVVAHRTLLSPWVRSARLYRLDAAASEWVALVPGESITAAAQVHYALRLELLHRGQQRVLQFVLPGGEGLR